MVHPFLERLRRGPLLADGAMGTLLHARGAAFEQCVEELNLTQPDWVRKSTWPTSRRAPKSSRRTLRGQPHQAERYNLDDKMRDINFRG